MAVVVVAGLGCALLLVTPTSQAQLRTHDPVASSATSAPPHRTRARGLSPSEVRALRPPMVWRPIPFGAARKRQTARYSWRHYRQRTYHLTDPRVVVEHYTDGPTMMSAWWTMSGNSRNLGEKPGVCAHFIIDRDGTIYHVVRLDLRCRHTIGLNQTAIGIEHVGTSDAQVMQDRAQRRASLRLTVWLMARYGIEVRNVIGHGESLLSPLRHERYRSWRCQTHTDFSHRTMHRYRQRLRDRAGAAGVAIGPPPRWVHPC